MKMSLILDVVAKGTDRIVKMTRDTRNLSDKGMAPLARTTEAVTRAAERNGRQIGVSAAQVARWGREARGAATKGITPLVRATDAVTRAADRNERQIARVTASTFRWMRATLRAADAIDRAGARTARFVGRAGLKGIELGAIGAAKGLSLVIRKTLDLTKAAVGYGALAAGAVGGWLVGGTVKTAATFEQMQVALEGTEGSADKAKAAMGWVAKFAKDTPYQVEEVTDAFVRARGVGIDPMTGAMTKMGDAAGGARKSLMDAVEALADAQTGEFERLKEFNITSSVKGDQVTFSYIDKAGKNAEKSVKKSMGNIRDAVLGIFDEKYGGGMLRQSRTLMGIWNNIQDSFLGFQLRVANAGFFDHLKGKLQGVLEGLDRLDQDGSLDRWAGNISDWLSKAVDKADEFVHKDWSSVAHGMGAIVSTLVGIVGLIGDAASAWSRWQNAVQKRQAQNVIDGWFSSPSARINARIRLGEIRDEENGLKGQTGRKVGNGWLGALRNGPPALLAKAGARSGQPVAGNVGVTVDFKNVPQGVRTRTKSTGPVSTRSNTSYRGPANGGPS
ncbi:MAG TPA: tape measure protein [Sphingobium sp.]